MSKHEIFRERKQDFDYYSYPIPEPSKLEKAIAFISLLTLLAVTIPLATTLVIISFKCLKIAIEIYKQ